MDRRRLGWVLVLAAVLAAVSSCAEVDELIGQERTSPPVSLSPPVKLWAPDAPIAELRSQGTKCFASAEAVSAAAARIEAANAVRIAEIRQRRRVADETGDLPEYNFDMLAEASDPDSKHCITVSTFRYEDQFVD